MSLIMSTSTTVRIHLRSAPIGRHFVVEAGNLRIEGWRPTKRWAKKAALRRAGKLELAADGYTLTGA